LLDQSIYHCRHPESSHPALRLRDIHSSYRSR
jgi:hypothetical protein